MVVFVTNRREMKNCQFTAHIERDEETSMYVGYIPSLPGAYTQGKSLDV